MSSASCSHLPCFLLSLCFLSPLQWQPSSLLCALVPDSGQMATLSALSITASASLLPSDSSGILFCVIFRTPQISVPISNDRRRSMSKVGEPGFAKLTNRFSAKSPACGGSRGLVCKNPFYNKKFEFNNL
jgi:hypothetical protein